MTDAELQLWLVRGDALGCFPNRLAQVRYADAWAYGEASSVVAELERILTRVHRMPALNALSCPDVVEMVDALEDGPAAFPEDWTEADFAIRLPDGTAASAAWLAGAGREELLAWTVREFLFLGGGAKVEAARRWRDACLEARLERGLSLDSLVWGAARAEFLTVAAGQSEALRAILGEDSLAELTATAPELTARAGRLEAARRRVLAPAEDEVAMLTMAALRACEHVFQVDALLANATSPLTANLLYYLRCADAPAPSPPK